MGRLYVKTRFWSEFFFSSSIGDNFSSQLRTRDTPTPAIQPLKKYPHLLYITETLSSCFCRSLFFCCWATWDARISQNSHPSVLNGHKDLLRLLSSSMPSPIMNTLGRMFVHHCFIWRMSFPFVPLSQSCSSVSGTLSSLTVKLAPLPVCSLQCTVEGTIAVLKLNENQLRIPSRSQTSISGWAAMVATSSALRSWMFVRWRLLSCEWHEFWRFSAHLWAALSTSFVEVMIFPACIVFSLCICCESWEKCGNEFLNHLFDAPKVAITDWMSMVRCVEVDLDVDSEALLLIQLSCCVFQERNLPPAVGSSRCFSSSSHPHHSRRRNDPLARLSLCAQAWKRGVGWSWRTSSQLSAQPSHPDTPTSLERCPRSQSRGSWVWTSSSPESWRSPRWPTPRCSWSSVADWSGHAVESEWWQ